MDDRAGMRLVVRTCGAGPKLVLFHGGLGSWNHWIRNLDALAQRFTVHAVDLPGQGESFAVPKDLAHDAYVDAVIAGLRPIVGEAPFALAGFSFGAVVATMAAARLGEKVRALSLLGAVGFGPIHSLPMKPIPHESEGEAARRAVFRHNLGVVMIADPAAITEETIDLHAYNFERSRYDTRAVSLGSHTEASLPKIACPVQFIYGERDAIAQPYLASRADGLRRANARYRFEIVPGAGHWVQYEAADTVNGLLLEFLTS